MLMVKQNLKEMRDRFIGNVIQLIFCIRMTVLLFLSLSLRFVFNYRKILNEIFSCGGFERKIIIMLEILILIFYAFAVYMNIRYSFQTGAALFLIYDPTFRKYFSLLHSERNNLILYTDYQVGRL